MTTHTHKSVWRCDSVGGLGVHVTCHMLRFLSTGVPFLPAALSAAQSAGIQVTQWAILRFFAPQGDTLHRWGKVGHVPNFTPIAATIMAQDPKN